MIDKLAPPRSRRTGPPASAFLHAPRANSQSGLLARPAAQLKLLKELGLVRPGAEFDLRLRLR
jgi:hypothetical protein